MPESDYQFESQSERDIHALLDQLFGPFVAAYFLDACRLVHQHTGWNTTSHLVAHLMREIDSMIRGALLPIDFKLTREQAKQVNAAQIDAIVGTLEVEGNDDIAAAWKSLEMHRRAHRSGLGFDPPRPIDSEFMAWWDQWLTVMKPLLVACRDRHRDLMQPVEDLAERTSPTGEEADALIRRLSQNPLLMNRVLAKIASPEWLPLLHARGFFRYQDARANGYRHWPPAQLLARMAVKAPEAIRECLMEVDWPIHNTLVAHSFLEAANALPPDDLVQLVSKIQMWVGAVRTIQFDNPLGEVIAALAMHMPDDAFKMFRTAIELKYSVEDRYRAISEPDSRFTNNHLYSRFLSTCSESLAQADASRLLTTLFERFREFEDASAKLFRDESGVSYYIHHFRQNVLAPTESYLAPVLNSVINVARDVARRALDDGLVTPEVLYALADDAESFGVHRIVMAVLASSTIEDSRVAWLYLSSRDRVYDHYQLEEYLALLARYFPILNADGQQQMILHCTTPTGIGDSGDDIEYIKRQCDLWILRRLRAIAKHLEGDAKRLLDDLESRSGEVLNKAIDEEMGGMRAVKGPKSSEELGAMAPADAITLVENWKPGEEDPFYIGPDGLLAALSDAVAAKPNDYIAILSLVCDGTFRSRSRVLSGIVAAVRQGKPIDWDMLMPRIDALMIGSEADASSELSREDRERRQWMRQELATLFDQSISSNACSIPDEHVEAALGYLGRLASDPDPSADRDGSRKGVQGASHVAINSVAGVAYSAMARVLCRIDDKDVHTRVWRDPVCAAVDAYLGDRSKWRRPLHVMMGRLFPSILRLDRAHALAVRHLIFPRSGEGDGPFFDAAWEGLHNGWSLGEALFLLLRDEYIHSFGRFAPSDEVDYEFLVADRSCSVHLYSRHCSGLGEYGDSDDLVELFEQSAPPRLLREVVDALGRAKLSSSSDVDMWTGRAVAFVERRLDVYASKPDCEACHQELGNLSSWLRSSLYLAGKVLELIKRMLEVSGRVPQNGRIVDEVTKIGEEWPEQAAGVLEIVAASNAEEWVFLYRADRLARVVKAIEQAGLGDRARLIVNRLSARGITLPEVEHEGGE